MDFLPVLVVSNTEQHVVLSVRRSALNPRVSNSLIKHALVFNSSVLSPTKPFRDDQPVAQPTREASTSDSYVLWYYPFTEQQFSVFVINAVVTMNIQVRNYFWQHSSGGFASSCRKITG